VKGIAIEASGGKEGFHLSFRGSRGQIRNENPARLESRGDFLDLTPRTKENLGIIEDHSIYCLGCRLLCFHFPPCDLFFVV
jgi:hypothetical protein